MLLGALTGELVNPVGGGLLGAIVGLTPVAEIAIDIAALALQNVISQGTPLPVSQGKSCCNLIGLASADPLPLSVACECEKY